MKVVLGIDTSCYTTSIAAVGIDGKLISHYRKVLTVGQGERGLQQSQAVFQHIHNLPDLVEQTLAQISSEDILAVSASTKPRPIEDSYMPVFTVGENVGRMTSAFLKVPFYECTHQEGHIQSGLWSAGGPAASELLAVHLSGGTTEILKIQKCQDGMDIELLGGTLDLHAGQFVDRVGVALGLPFPAGPSLENMAQQASSSKEMLPSWVSGLSCSFSGAESQAQRYIAEGKEEADIALETLLCISRTLVKLIVNANKKTGLERVLIVGGVASNQIIREYVNTHLNKRNRKIQVYYSAPQFSSDNAVGTALLGLQRHLSTGEI